MSLCAKFHTFVPICAMVQLTALTNMPHIRKMLPIQAYAVLWTDFVIESNTIVLRLLPVAFVVTQNLPHTGKRLPMQA